MHYRLRNRWRLPLGTKWGDRADVQGRIRTERERLRLSISQLAAASGLSKAYVVRLETDPASNPSLDVLRRIADALDVTVADLTGHTRVTASDDQELPASLKVFADEAGLSEAELRTLASIRWRKGEVPQTSARWRFVLDSLRVSRQLDDRQR